MQAVDQFIHLQSILKYDVGWCASICKGEKTWPKNMLLITIDDL